MLYLVRKDVKIKKRLVFKDDLPRPLYVSDTHTFDLKGKQLITLTDVKDYGQEFTLEEANAFVKKNRKYTIEAIERDEEYEYEDEE